MTPFVFTDNISDVIAVNGKVKIVAKGIEANSQVLIQEEQPDNTYETANKSWSILTKEDSSKILNLLGNYRVRRSSANIAVGYEFE